MRSTQQEVQHRILVAARSEFAAYGLAGARIDRIATSASASKERLYSYYGDKAALFQAVLDLNTAEFFAAVRLDADDVCAFVADLYDHATQQPEHLRMLDWARLGGVEYQTQPSEEGPEAKLDAIRRGQAGGKIDPHWDPAELLAMLFSLALSWAQSPDRSAATDDPDVRASRRIAVVEAARRLVDPRSSLRPRHAAP